MTARAFSANPDLFSDSLIAAYLSCIEKALASPKPQDAETGLSALFVTLQQKKILKHMKDQPDLIKQWLKYAKTTSGEIRVAFLISLEGLLKRGQESAEEHAAFIYRIVANLFHPENVFTTAECNLKPLLLYLVQFLNTPFPQEELAALRVLQSIALLFFVSEA